MSNQSSDLYQAMREYVQAAMQFLASVCPEGPSRIVRGLAEWRRDDPFFRLHEREEPYWVECIQGNLEKLHAIDEYRRLAGLIRDIPEINQQLDNLVGTGLGGSRIETHDVTDHLIWRLPQISKGLSFNEDHFNHLFENLEADLGRTSIPYVLLAPLLGLEVEVAPVELGSDISITYMTDDEITRCLNLGVFPDFLISPGVAHVDRVATVRVQFSLDKRVGHNDLGQRENALELYSVARGQAIDVLYALRVFKNGRVSVPGFVEFSPHWPLEGGTSFQHSNPGPMPKSNKYDLSGKEVEFKAFWSQFQQGTARRAAGNAVRRFNFANDRERDDDKIVDLMFAAESLFLADSSTPQERGEQRYRCALRAAFFIEGLGYSRREIFNHVRRAYDVRSAIVHGADEIDGRLLKSRTDELISLQDFVKITESFIRSALTKRIQLAATSGSTFIDWNDLILSPDDKRWYH